MKCHKLYTSNYRSCLESFHFHTLHYDECQEKFVKTLVVGLWKSQASAVVDLKRSVFVLAIKYRF